MPKIDEELQETLRLCDCGGILRLGYMELHEHEVTFSVYCQRCKFFVGLYDTAEEAVEVANSVGENASAVGEVSITS